jgi:hypothetical protein
VKNGRFSCFNGPFPSIPFIPLVQTSPGDTSSTTIASMHRLVGLPWLGGEGGAKQCRSNGIDRISFFMVFSLVLRSTIDSRRLVRLLVFSMLCSMCSKIGLGWRADRACMGGLGIGRHLGASSSKPATNDIFSPLKRTDTRAGLDGGRVRGHGRVGWVLGHSGRRGKWGFRG